MSSIDLSQLRVCTEDTQRAAQDSDPGPKDPTRYDDLLKRLAGAGRKLPPLYRETVDQPFILKLQELGASGFRTVLRRDSRREGTAGTMLDIAQAILQNGEEYQAFATDSFQEVVSDLYDGFLSAEDRRGVKQPDRGVIPPLVKWGNPDSGPYTWPVDATISFGAKAGIVSLPPANARRGLLAWAALGHETAGHDILDADTGLREELADALEARLRKAKMPSGLPEYWSDRIDETASDVMGILNLGPVAGIGLVGYFRGLNAAWGDGPTLRNQGPADDPHPADIVRGFLAASTVRLLSFALAGDWSRAIEAEALRDLDGIVLGGREVPTARRSADIVATVLVRSRMRALENHALGEIQNWRDHDEGTVASLRALLRSDRKPSARYLTGVYAAHVVAAAVTAALEKGGRVARIFERMQAVLKILHDVNPSWGPLYVAHPGDVTRRRSTRLRRVAGGKREPTYPGVPQPARRPKGTPPLPAVEVSTGGGRPHISH